MIVTSSKTTKPRKEADAYYTPPALCRAAVDLLPGEAIFGRRVLDLGAGDGEWGRAVKDRWPEALVDGVEMRDLPCPDGYDGWYPRQDVRMWGAEPDAWDIVVGNPPYGLDANGNKDRVLAEKFVRQALRCVRPGGYVLYLLRQAFLESVGRARGLWLAHPPLAVYTVAGRPSFPGYDGKSDTTAYGIFIWRKGYQGPHYTGGWLDWQREAQGELFGGGVAALQGAAT